MRQLEHKQWVVTVATMLMRVVAQGCASVNPIAAAETPDQRAYAMFGTYTIAAEKAADLAENSQLPNSVRLGLVEVEEDAAPVVVSMMEALGTYEAIRAELAAGETGRDRYVIAATNLASWVDRVAPLVSKLVTAVEDVGQ